MNMALDVVRKFLNENLRELTVPVYTAHDVHTGNQQDFHTANESRVGSIGSTINNGSNHSTINVNFNFYIGESSVESIPLKTTPPAPPRDDTGNGGNGSSDDKPGASRKRTVRTSMSESEEVCEMETVIEGSGLLPPSFKRVRHTLNPDVDEIEIE